MCHTQWFGTQTRYEGLPLALRVRAGLTAGDWPAHLPHLAVLTHQFDVGRTWEDGMPKTEYNRSLARFDAAAHDVVGGDDEHPERGRRDGLGVVGRAARRLVRGRPNTEPLDPATVAGVVLIVETFNGQRNYYAAVRDEARASAWLATLRRRFSGLDLSVEFDAGRAERFYRRYTSEFGVPEP